MTSTSSVPFRAGGRVMRRASPRGRHASDLMVGGMTVVPSVPVMGDLFGEIGMRPRPDRRWTSEAIRLIEADFNRSADTHLVPVPLPATPGISLYLKDESTHPTGSLKHRLARSLFLYGLCNGRIGPTTTIVEASSGSTAVSEAYFARLLEPAVRGGDAALHDVGRRRSRPSSHPLGRTMSPRRRRGGGLRRGGPARGRSFRRPLHGSVQRSPSARRTGAATTTSRNRSLRRWRGRTSRSPRGSWSAPEPGARRRPSAGSSAFGSCRRGSASPTPPHRCFIGISPTRLSPRRPDHPPSSKESAGRVANRRSSPS